MDSQKPADTETPDPKALLARNIKFFSEVGKAIHAKFEPHLNGPPTEPRERPQFKLMNFDGTFPTREDIDVFTFSLLFNTLKRCKTERIPFLTKPRAPHSYYLLVVGCPTTWEFEQLLKEFKPKCLLLHEPDLSLLARSMYELDWSKHLLELQQAGGEVHFLLDQAPEIASGNAWRIARRINPCKADHFACLILDHHEHGIEVGKTLARDLNLVGSHLGYFQDELLMIYNNFNNLNSGKARIYDRGGERRINAPCFVIGSGPSLDDDLEFIRENQDKAVIITAGSSLLPTVSAGIKPDFHLENENVNVRFRFDDISKDHDLSGLHLVASATVETPALDSLDDETILYYRVALSPFAIFSGDAQTSIRLPDPTVGNAALCFALEAGFTDIYLFGLDFGTRAQGDHHAKKTIYHTMDGIEHDTPYNLSIPGNFQETVWTSRYLLPAASNASDAVMLLSGGRTVVNCSDGAKIRGTKGVRSADLKIKAPGIGKAAVIENLLDEYPLVDGSVAWDNKAFMGAAKEFASEFRACIGDDEKYLNGEYQAPMMKLLKLRTGFIDPAEKGVEDAALILYRGTLLALILFLEFYATRVATPGYENKFRLIAREELLKIFEFMENMTDSHLGSDVPKEPPSIDERIAPKGAELPPLHRPARNDPCYCGSGKKYKHCHGRPGMPILK